MGKLISVPKQMRLGELFCGPGGIGLGAHFANKRNKVARFIHAFALDKDIDSIKELKEELESKWHSISSKLYQQSGSSGEQQTEDSTEETEFEEVD